MASASSTAASPRDTPVPRLSIWAAPSARRLRHRKSCIINCLMADVVTGYASDAGTNMADYGCSNLTATAAKRRWRIRRTRRATIPLSSPSKAPPTGSTAGNRKSRRISSRIQPDNRLSQGQSASFTVSATGIPNPAYQWLKDSAPISGATGATFGIASAVRANAGNYSVIVSNAAGSVTSSVAALTYTGNVAPVAGSTFTLGAVIGMPTTVKIVGGKFRADGCRRRHADDLQCPERVQRNRDHRRHQHHLHGDQRFL